MFNRGFWDGYYQGARLGEWSNVYGSQATKVKVNLGRITNWFGKLSVAEVSLESNDLHKGDEVMIIGATSGVNQFAVDSLRLEEQDTDFAPKGSVISIRVPLEGGEQYHPRRGDKIYLWKENIK